MYPIRKKKQKKQKKKIACQEDRISNLPDEILVHILSFLHIKGVARTSILSTRWRYLWTWIPSLDFRWCTPKVIDRCLDLHRAPKLRSVKYGYNYYSYSPAVEKEELNRWVRYSATHGVEELFIFRSYHPKDHPASLFECQSLVQLTLKYGKFNLPVNFCGFKSLVTLCLEEVFIKGEELCTLISTCDLLENLKVIRCRFAEKPHKISATNSSRLRNLKIISGQAHDDHRSSGCDRLEVNASSLLFFTCIGWKLSWSDFPHLCEADLKFISLDSGWNENLWRWRRILSAITCVRTLMAGNWLFQRPKCRKHLPVPFHDHFVFKNLKELNVYIEYKESNDYLASFISLLKASPALETVCLYVLLSGLETERDKCIKYDEVRLWLKQIQDPIFSHDRLKTLQLAEFISNKTELLLLKFLLEKTIALESLTLILRKKITKTESELLKNELNHHKASPNAQIVIFS